MKPRPSLIAAIAFGLCARPALTQDVNGLRIGMSKAEVCGYMREHPTYRFTSGTSCPGIDNRVTIVGTPDMLLARVSVAFQNDGAVAAIWARFPSANFEAVKEDLIKSYGKPRWGKKIEAGECGATVANLLLYWAASSSSRAAARLRRRNGGDIYLEQFNEVEDGKMTAWIALNPYLGFDRHPPVCLQY